MHEQEHQGEDHQVNTDPVQYDVTVSPDDKGIVQDDGIQKATPVPVFL